MTAPLIGSVTARVDLDSKEIDEMYAIFQEFYEQTTPEIFRRDLSGKNWAIRMHDEQGNLQGFTTMALYETLVLGKPISVVYSGDTIIRPAYWGTFELPRTWGRAVLELSRAMVQPLYWLLISSGYKTYRFLPVFCQEFYPRCAKPTPPEIQTIIDTLARERFGDEYLPDLGIVRFIEGATPLRQGIADVDDERLRDPHIAFFVTCNPGYLCGDELVCLAQIHPDNFTAAAKRLLRDVKTNA